MREEKKGCWKGRDRGGMIIILYSWEDLLNRNSSIGITIRLIWNWSQIMN